MGAVTIIQLSPEQLEEIVGRAVGRALGGRGQGEPAGPSILTTEEAAAQARRSPDTIRKWIKSGRLRTLPRIGKQHIRIRPADLVAAMERALDASAPVDELAEVRAKIARARQRSAGQG